MRENLAGFRLGHSSAVQVFTLRPIVEYMRTFCRPTISIFLGLKVAFDPVGRAVLWSCLSLNNAPERSVSLFDLCMWTPEAELVLTAICHWNLRREVVSVRVPFFNLFFSTLSRHPFQQTADCAKHWAVLFSVTPTNHGQSHVTRGVKRSQAMEVRDAGVAFHNHTTVR